ncbi:Peptidyl-prolyl cis-trans isomerase D, partial [Galemys pyrenaicus]
AKGMSYSNCQEFFAATVFKTAEKICALYTGEKDIRPTARKPLHYEGCPFNQVIKKFMILECRELKEGNALGIIPKDDSSANHPDFPEDADIDLKKLNKISLIAKDLKNIGNIF